MIKMELIKSFNLSFITNITHLILNFKFTMKLCEKFFYISIFKNLKNKILFELFQFIQFNLTSGVVFFKKCWVQKRVSH